jgi:5-methylcytosine-specific restriction endonuclease McrA
MKTLRPRLKSLRAATLKPAPKVGDKLYESMEWRALVRATVEQRGRRCELCGSTDRIYGDHIVEVRDGGAPLDPNVMLLCAPCHGRKTAAAREARAARRW